MRTERAALVVGAALLAGCGPGGEGGEHPGAYITRAEAAAAMVELKTAKVAVAQHYQLNGRWPSDDELARMAPNVYVGDGTEIVIDVEGRSASGSLALRYDSDARTWTCVAYDIPDAALPPNCR